MLEVAAINQRGHTTTGSGQNGIDLEKLRCLLASCLIYSYAFKE